MAQTIWKKLWKLQQFNSKEIFDHLISVISRKCAKQQELLHELVFIHIPNNHFEITQTTFRTVGLCHSPIFQINVFHYFNIFMSRLKIRHHRPNTPIIYEPLSNRTSRIRTDSARIMIPIILGSSDIDTYKSQDFKPFITRPNSPQNNTSHQKLSNSVEFFNNKRKTSCYAKKDKENLNSDLISSKVKINLLEDQNSKLQVKIKLLEKKNDELSELITNVQNFAGFKDLKQSEVKEMKKQIKELKATLSDREEQFKKMKQDIKFTKLSELQLEIKESQQESMRLRTLLDQSLRTQGIIQMTQDLNKVEEKYYIQMQVINSLKQENEYMAGMYRFEEEENFRLRLELIEQDKQQQKYQNLIIDLKKELSTKNLGIQRTQLLLEEYNSVNSNLIQKTKTLDGNEEKCTLKDQLIKQLEKQINDRDCNIDYLDKTVIELKQKLSETQVAEAKQRKNLQEELSKLEKVYEDLNDKYRNVLLINAQSKLKETVPSSMHSKQTIMLNYQPKTQKRINQFEINESQYMLQMEYAPKKLRVIKSDNMKDIGMELNMRFRLKKSPLNDVIEQYVFVDQNKKRGIVSIKELHQRFRKQGVIVKIIINRDPFILDSEKAMILARYMIEDNSEEFVDFVVDRTGSYISAKAIFSKVVGNFRILSFDEEFKLKDEITQVKQQIVMSKIIVKYRNSLKQYLDQQPTLRGGEINKKQLIDALTYMVALKFCIFQGH